MGAHRRNRGSGGTITRNPHSFRCPNTANAWLVADDTATWPQAPEICPPAERLPDWSDSTTTVREKFARMGLDDKVRTPALWISLSLWLWVAHIGLSVRARSRATSLCI